MVICPNLLFLFESTLGTIICFVFLVWWALSHVFVDNNCPIEKASGILINSRRIAIYRGKCIP